MARLLLVILLAGFAVGCAGVQKTDGDARVDSTDEVPSDDGPVTLDPEDMREE